MMISALQLIVSQIFRLPNHHALKTCATLIFCTVLMVIAQSSQADNTGRIVKWKDEKGVTHYGDKIPPQYSNRENSLMNKQGITIQQNKIGTHEDIALEQARIEQDKKDKALLGTFSSAQEIDLTRDRNLEPDLIVIKGLQQDRAQSQKKFEKMNAQASAYTKSKKAIPAELSSELQASQAQLAKIDQKIAERQRAIDGIRQRFDEDKKRYLYLRGMSHSH